MGDTAKLVSTFNNFCGRQIESIIGLRCRQRNPNSRANGKMPETRFTEFPALSVDPRVGISWSASGTDGWLFFLPIIIGKS